jgi:hypothetical protein
MAIQRPRSEEACFAKLIAACGRLSFAEIATYSFPRGGQTITGPSVYFAREAARIWGNISYGVRFVDSDLDTVRLRGFAHDLETNTHHEFEDEAQKTIQRKDKRTGETKWIEADERELRELQNRRGAILERNCILKIIPSDIIESAIDECRKTLKKATEGKLGVSREEQIKKLTIAFMKHGVSAEQIERWAERKLSELTTEQIAELRQIHNSIKDGNSSPAEHFETTKTATQALNDSLKQPQEFTEEVIEEVTP